MLTRNSQFFCYVKEPFYVKLETKELKTNDKLKRKIEMIGRFTNTTPIINNGYVKNITGTNVAYVMPHIIAIKNNK